MFASSKTLLKISKCSMSNEIAVGNIKTTRKIYYKRRSKKFPRTLYSRMFERQNPTP